MKHIKKFEQLLLENYHSKQPIVKKGDKVKVKMNYFKGAPEYDVEAYGDSCYNEETGIESFSYKMGGDMMMIAQLENDKWISL